MSKPRKFRRTLARADATWQLADFTMLMIDVLSEVPPEYRESVCIELGELGASYLAVTAVMTDSFDYTDSEWEPA